MINRKKIFLLLLISNTAFSADMFAGLVNIHRVDYQPQEGESYKHCLTGLPEKICKELENTKKKFELQTQRDKDNFVSCIDKGIDSKTCLDPHWCLYPDKINTNECVWYRTKYKL